MNQCSEVGPGGVCGTSTLREAFYYPCLPSNRCCCPCHTLQLPLPRAPSATADAPVANTFDTLFSCPWLLPTVVIPACHTYYPHRLHFYSCCLCLTLPPPLSFSSSHPCCCLCLPPLLLLLLQLLLPVSASLPLLHLPLAVTAASACLLLVLVALPPSHCCCYLCMSPATSVTPVLHCSCCMIWVAGEVSAVNKSR